jgi:hypothetical protein
MLPLVPPLARLDPGRAGAGEQPASAGDEVDD